MQRTTTVKWLGRVAEQHKGIAKSLECRLSLVNSENERLGASVIPTI